jgi:hypothetical protein
MTLNKKQLKTIGLAILLLGILYWLNDITTPKQCKVPVAHMSQFCKDLLFPH